jgi:protein AaeX
MTAEIDLYGVFIPSLLLWVAAALPLTAVLLHLLRWLGFYRFVWHRPLFDFALLVIVLGGVVALTAHWVIP